MAGFIAVHCGAGFHSKENDSEYKSLCKLACAAALEAYKISENPVDAVNAAIIALEDNPLTNAGFGSNLTWDGNVECDACVMDGTTMNFGACGAVGCIKNPISLASQICLKQSDTMVLGRIPPCILVGTGAEKWATAIGIPHVQNISLVSTKSRERHKKNQEKFRTLEQSAGMKLGPLDTVGAIFVGEDGRTAAGCSSGGIAFKHSGRIGQAATFACGCWAENNGQVSLATSTSGCGEHIIKTMLAKQIADDIKEGDCPMASLEMSIRKRFLCANAMQNEEQKLAGAVCLTYDPIVGKGEVVYGYTTKSMCVGYASSYKDKFIFECTLSRKLDEQPIMICGSSFQLRENLETLLATKNKKQVECIEVARPAPIMIDYEALNKDAKNLKKVFRIYDRKEQSKKRKAERKERHLSPPLRTENINELSIEKQIGRGQPGKPSSRRVAVLNKLFMKHVTDLMATGEASSDIVGRGIEISRVKVSSDFNHVYVFWLAKGTDTDATVERILEESAPNIRHELSQLRIMGQVPKIEFVKDKQYAKISEVAERLAVADFGDDFEPTDPTIRLKTEFSLNLNIPNNVKDAIKDIEANEQNEVAEDPPLPPMRMDVLGLNHSEILNMVQKSFKKPKITWQNSETNNSNAINSSALDENTTTISIYTSKEQKERFTKFLQKQQLLKMKVGKKEKYSNQPDQECYFNEYETEENDKEFDKDSDYVEELEDGIKY